MTPASDDERGERAPIAKTSSKETLVGNHETPRASGRPSNPGAAFASPHARASPPPSAVDARDFASRTMAIECAVPHASAMATPSTSTRAGEGASRPLGRPSFPPLPSPSAYTAPARVRSNACLDPSAISTTSSVFIPSIACGSSTRRHRSLPTTKPPPDVLSTAPAGVASANQPHRYASFGSLESLPITLFDGVSSRRPTDDSFTRPPRLNFPIALATVTAAPVPPLASPPSRARAFASAPITPPRIPRASLAKFSIPNTHASLSNSLSHTQSHVRVTAPPASAYAIEKLLKSSSAPLARLFRNTSVCRPFNTRSTRENSIERSRPRRPAYVSAVDEHCAKTTCGLERRQNFMSGAPRFTATAASSAVISRMSSTRKGLRLAHDVRERDARARVRMR